KSKTPKMKMMRFRTALSKRSMVDLVWKSFKIVSHVNLEGKLLLRLLSDEALLTKFTKHVTPGSVNPQQRVNLDKLVQHLAHEPDHDSDLEMLDHDPQEPKPTALAVANSPNATLTSVTTSIPSFQDLAPEPDHDSDLEILDARPVPNSPNATPTPPQQSVGVSANSTPVLAASTKNLQPWTQGILAMKTLSLSSALERFIESKPDYQALKAFLGEDRNNQDLEKVRRNLRRLALHDLCKRQESFTNSISNSSDKDISMKIKKELVEVLEGLGTESKRLLGQEVIDSIAEADTTFGDLYPLIVRLYWISEKLGGGSLFYLNETLGDKAIKTFPKQGPSFKAINKHLMEDLKLQEKADKTGVTKV
ncbi:MAG: hypothetical protein Q9180_006895, partial [Flavoplaca navasiana]